MESSKKVPDAPEVDTRPLDHQGLQVQSPAAEGLQSAQGFQNAYTIPQAQGFQNTYTTPSSGYSTIPSPSGKGFDPNLAPQWPSPPPKPPRTICGFRAIVRNLLVLLLFLILTIGLVISASLAGIYSSQNSSSSSSPAATPSSAISISDLPTDAAGCPSTNATTYTSGTKTFLVLCNIDYPAASSIVANSVDTSNTSVPSLSMCADACAASVNCVGASWKIWIKGDNDDSQAHQERCYLKSVLGSQEERGGGTGSNVASVVLVGDGS